MTQVQPNRRKYDRHRDRMAVWDVHALDDIQPDTADHGQRETFSLPPAGRVLGVDYGVRRVGLAISDPTGRIAQGLETIETANPEAVLKALEQVVARLDIRKIVVGLPVNMDGTIGTMATRVIEFVAALSDRTDARVVTWDERLTSQAAHRAMVEMGLSVKGRKKTIDRISATIILQGYLDSVRQVHAATGHAIEERLCSD